MDWIARAKIMTPCTKCGKETPTMHNIYDRIYREHTPEEQTAWNMLWAAIDAKDPQAIASALEKKYICYTEALEIPLCPDCRRKFKRNYRLRKKLEEALQEWNFDRCRLNGHERTKNGTTFWFMQGVDNRIICLIWADARYERYPKVKDREYWIISIGGEHPLAQDSVLDEDDCLAIAKAADAWIQDYVDNPPSHAIYG